MGEGVLGEVFGKGVVFLGGGGGGREGGGPGGGWDREKGDWRGVRGRGRGGSVERGTEGRGASSFGKGK